MCETRGNSIVVLYTSIIVIPFVPHTAGSCCCFFSAHFLEEWGLPHLSLASTTVAISAGIAAAVAHPRSIAAVTSSGFHSSLTHFSSIDSAWSCSIAALGSNKSLSCQNFSLSYSDVKVFVAMGRCSYK